MAKKIDDELIKDVRVDNKKFIQTNPQTDAGTNNTTAPTRGEASTEPELKNVSNETNSTTNQPLIEPEKDDFKEKYEEYFKGIGSTIAGSVVVNMVDDLKTNLLYIHAKKQGVDIPKEALQMDEKAKTFAAFLVDYGIKNKMFDLIKKHPLLAAGGVVAISGLTTYLMVEMMKTKTDDNAKLKAEVELLKSQLNEKNKLTIEKSDLEVKDFVKSM